MLVDLKNGEYLPRDDCQEYAQYDANNPSWKV